MATIKQYECKRCKKKWFPRKPGKPKMCPQCKTLLWNVAKKAKESK